jgi:hypothetical protein
MKKLNLFLVISVALSLIVCLSGCGGTPITPPIEEDFINIISVTPDSGLVYGVDTDFKVVVEYNLVSSNLGVLQIGFNNVCYPSGCYIEAYEMRIEDGDFLVNKGSGIHEFNVTIMPKDYGSQGNFKVLAILTKVEVYYTFITDIELFQIGIGGEDDTWTAAIDEEVLTFQ